MIRRFIGGAITVGIVFFWIAVLWGFLWFAQLPIFASGKNTINFYVWGDVIDEQLVAQFERETGIGVNLNYYENNEELLVKLQVTQGRGFDLLMPSDYAVRLLSNAGLLKKIDHSKLTFIDRLNPIFMNHYYDPHNNYSIPFSAAIYGLGTNLTYFPERKPEASWSEIFESKYLEGQSIVMVNDPREVVTLATFYLFGKVEALDPVQEQQVIDLLINQKKYVGMYTDFLGGQLLGANACSMALTPSILACGAHHENPAVRFLIPREGTFIAIECLVIPAHSTKEDLVYQFINYLYRPDVMRENMERVAFYPVCADISFECEADADHAIGQLLTPEGIKTLQFFREDLIPHDQVNRIWLALKAS